MIHKGKRYRVFKTRPGNWYFVVGIFKRSNGPYPTESEAISAAIARINKML